MFADAAFRERPVALRRQLDQLGPDRHPGRLLRLRRAAPRRARAAVAFCVPTGNFGNVYAGWVARRLGLPVARLIVATNSNDILARFFDRRRLRARPGRRHRQPVDGHPGGEQLRAPAPRSRGRRCGAGCVRCMDGFRADRLARPRPRRVPRHRRHFRRRQRRRGRRRSPPSATRCARPASWSTPTPPSASPWPRATARPPARRSSRWPPPIRPSSRTRSARRCRRHADAARPPTPTSTTLPERCTVLAERPPGRPGLHPRHPRKAA